MLNRIYSNAAEEIRLINEVRKVTILDGTSLLKGQIKAAFEKQEKYTSRQLDTITTSYIFLEYPSALFKIDLNRSVYSDKFDKLKETTEKIIKQCTHEFNALHDNLTEIYNRHGLEEAISNQNLKEKTITYCIADIDNFKQINDSHSHDVGDNVIRHLAGKIRDSCSNIATEECIILFARYGGEEFVIIIIDDEGRPEIAETIRELSCGETNGIKYTISLGLSIQKIKTKTAPAALKKLYQDSDLALSKAKKEGKNKSVNFLKVREQSGIVLEADEKYGIIAIDLGSKFDAKIGDQYKVFPEKYSGAFKYVISDGRTQKTIGHYPKLHFCEIELFNVQDEISFCKLKEGDFSLLELGSKLELIKPTSKYIKRSRTTEQNSDIKSS